MIFWQKMAGILLLFCFSQASLSAGTDTASVFIAFASKHYGENYDQKMTSPESRLSWAERLEKRTINWTPEEATRFLNFLVENLGEQRAVERLKDFPTALRKGLRPQQLYANFEILSAWAGRKAATKKLDESFIGFLKKIDENTIRYFHQFLRKDKTDPNDMMEFLEVYLRDEHSPEKNELVSSLQGLFAHQGRLGDFDGKDFIHRMKSLIHNLGIKDYADSFVHFVDDYLKAQEKTKNMMLNNRNIFHQIDTQMFDQIATFLRQLKIPEERIQEIFEKELTAKMNKHRLENIVRRLKSFFVLEEVQEIVKQIILEDFKDFYRIDLQGFEQAFSFWGNRGISQENLKPLFKAIILMNRASKEKLEVTARYLDSFFASLEAKEVVNQMFLENPKENLKAFLYFDVDEFYQTVSFLRERGFSEDSIRGIFRRNPLAILVRRKKVEPIVQDLEVLSRL